MKVRLLGLGLGLASLQRYYHQGIQDSALRGNILFALYMYSFATLDFVALLRARKGCEYSDVCSM